MKETDVVCSTMTERLSLPYLDLCLTKLVQLQFSEFLAGGTLFGRLKRSMSAGVGGRRGLFFTAVEGREPTAGEAGRRWMYDDWGRAGCASRRLPSIEQAAHGRNCWLSRRWASECSLFTRKTCGGSKSSSGRFAGALRSWMARFDAVPDMIWTTCVKMKAMIDHSTNTRLLSRCLKRINRSHNDADQWKSIQSFLRLVRERLFLWATERIETEQNRCQQGTQQRIWLEEESESLFLIYTMTPSVKKIQSTQLDDRWWSGLRFLL